MVISIGRFLVVVLRRVVGARQTMGYNSRSSA